MEITQQIISEIRKEGKVIKRVVIKEKIVVDPEKIEDVGYNQEEQVSILQGSQDEYLLAMEKVIKDSSCRKCRGLMALAGNMPSSFHSAYTDHKIMMPKKKCKSCGNIFSETIHSLFGSSMHPDLMKKQAKVGSEMSYVQAQHALEREDGKVRSINNSRTIKNTVTKVGTVLHDLHQQINELPNTSAKQLIIQTDGGYVKDMDPKKQSFEVLISKIYKPEDHEHGYINDNGTRVSGIIKNKIYAASAFKDRHNTIKNMTIVAAQKHGMTKETKVTAISDGAVNCWNVLKAVKPYCQSVECILDWYHIKQRFESLANKVEDPYLSELESIKWQIWHGNHIEALNKLSAVYVATSTCEYTDKVHELFKYLSNNREYLVHYAARKEKQLPYTSSIIESAVESIINERYKKKHKAQWSRLGAHNVLQIRTSVASNLWNKEWKDTKNKLYKSHMAA